jgi:Peptidase family S41/Tricorn protease C1 domain
MKINTKLSGLLLVCSLCWACGDLLLDDNPKNTPENNFDLLWKDFDQLYSLFDLKKVDWDSLYAVYRPQVHANTSERELFSILSSLLANLNDGHVYLLAPFAGFVSNQQRHAHWAENFNFNNIRDTYLRNTLRVAGGGKLIYGNVTADIGYLYLASFEDEDFGKIDDWAKEIDGVVEALRAFKGLIVDVRNDGGGDAFNAQYIADRFADTRRLFAYGMSRSGPRHNDFSEFYEWYVAPDGPRQFTKPIVLLTNRGTASGAERFTLAMKTLPQVTSFGDTTEGAFPHALPRELPNGWAYRVTVGVVLTAQKTSYEGQGIPPDVPVSITAADASQRKDTILDEAIAFLNRQSSQP